MLTAADDDAAGSTLAANPYLKPIFGYAADAADADVAPFAPARFADPRRPDRVPPPPDRRRRRHRLPASHAPHGRLARLGRGHRARRSGSRRGAIRVEALIRDVSERKKLDDQSRDLYQQLLQAEKMAALGQTISASRTN